MGGALAQLSGGAEGVAVRIGRESPLTEDLALLMARHTEAMHADTPAESIHMLDASGLDRPEISFFVLRVEEAPLAMGAYKKLSPDHAEIKSMHVLAEARGHGLAQAMLDHLIAAAREEGIARLSLETGSQESFGAARALYLRAGFTLCEPFGSYAVDPMSVFMTLGL